jgi:anti-sigma regulatory factor (Ser/Thr protein kinase)
VGEAPAYATRLAVEELFTNLVRHNRGGREFVEIALEHAPRRLTIRLQDFDAEPFDPSSVPPPDLARPLGERASGGLGLHLVRQLVDRLDFEHEGGALMITAVKNLEDADVQH